MPKSDFLCLRGAADSNRCFGHAADQADFVQAVRFLLANVLCRTDATALITTISTHRPFPATSAPQANAALRFRPTLLWSPLIHSPVSYVPLRQSLERRSRSCLPNDGYGVITARTLDISFGD